ncbi:MAG: hypothetical protein ACTSSI_18265 [Candidatus Helarchaeota archaeon]
MDIDKGEKYGDVTRFQVRRVPTRFSESARRRSGGGSRRVVSCRLSGRRAGTGTTCGTHGTNSPPPLVLPPDEKY